MERERKIVRKRKEGRNRQRREWFAQKGKVIHDGSIVDVCTVQLV